MTFRTRTFVALLLASALALAASTALVTASLRDSMLEDIELAVLRQARLAAELLADRGAFAQPQAEAGVLEQLVNARVTFIDAAGRVVGDSDVPDDELAALDNHGAREEVVEALATGTGVAVRRSATTGDDTMYAAAAVSKGPIRIVRIGVPLTWIEDRIAATRRLAWTGLGVGLLAALLLTWGTSAWLARRVQAIGALARRYRQGDFTRPTSDFGDDEIGAVARVLDETARDLGTRLEDVARERAHMDAVLQGMVEGAMLLTAQGRLAVSNPAIRAMLRLSDDPHGRHYLEVVRQPQITALISSALAGTTSSPVEVQLDRDSRRTFVARVVPVETVRGGGAVLVLHDITDLRQADQVRRDFVANVSHELRTPLTAIRGYVEALSDSPADEAQTRKFLEIIARHASRMERLVNDLLRLARLDARQETVQSAVIQLPSLFEQLELELESTIAARQIVVEIDCAPDALAFSGDPAKIHDAFRNLLENAINYSPDGGTIELHSQRVGSQLEIRFSDRGPGIPEADLPRIFERFYRVDRSRTRDPRDPGGTGLGLSIVKHLIELHGGRVSARNRDGGGTHVVVTLPAIG
ncbi:MAG: ATP-binding protein [Vicinamibacterales bacterium]